MEEDKAKKDTPLETTHRRTASGGPELPPKPKHSRNVSFQGEQQKQNPKISPLELSPDMSSLGDPLGTTLEPPPELPRLNSKTSPKSSPGRGIYREITVQDLARTNPLENEAESYIIEALEQQDPVRNRLDTGTSTIFTQIPKETQDIMIEMDLVKEEGEQQEAEQGDQTEKAGTPAKKPDLSRIMSRATQATNMTRATGSDRTKKSERSKTPTERNHVEMAEDNLAGLTSQLNLLHKKAEHQMQPSELPMPTKLNMDMGVAEHFAAAATLLMRKRTAGGKSDDYSVGSGKSPKTQTRKNWDKVKQSIGQQELNFETARTEVPTPIPPPPGTDIEFGVENGETPKPIIEGEDTRPGEIGEGGAPRYKSKMTLRDRLSFFKEFEDFLSPRKNQIALALRATMFVVLPLLFLAFILFYAAGNPPTGKVDLEASQNGTLINTEGEVIEPHKASASWWLLYVVRHTFIFILAKGFEVFVIDFLCLGTGWFPKMAGSFFTLFVIQSRGWPFILTSWGAISWILLGGQYGFSAHWLYGSSIDIFNNVNPSGNITTSDWNTRFHAIAVSCGLVVAVKRLYIGVSQSRKTFSTYASELQRVVQKILLITEVASAARDYEWRYHERSRMARSFLDSANIRKGEFRSLVQELNHDEGSLGPDRKTSRDISAILNTQQQHLEGQGGIDFIIDTTDLDPLTGSLKLAQKAKISELLGAWEDPEKERKEITSNISIRAILQFRQSVTFMENPFLFSLSYGLADTRVNCIHNAQELYQRLFLRTPNADILHFEVMAFCAIKSDGSLDQNKLKELIRIFRPDRDGNLSMLDFVKSIDTVYKEVKFLRASIRSSQRTDHALEQIFNVIFYGLMVTVILSALGLDPLSIFLSLSSLIVGFAFMIGSAASQYFMGVLLIMFRKPYDIGDRINISALDVDTSASGSSGWIVKNITLHTTTLMYATTGEICTVSNGALANTRIINAARSPRAVLYVYAKFGVETSFEKIKIFEDAARKFVKARPREWLSFIAFRATRVEPDLGFVEYITVLQHRESWQNIGALLQSKADMSSFYLELSKKLDMKYRSPPLPVDLSMGKKAVDTSQLSKASDDLVQKIGSDGGSFDGNDMYKLAAFFTGT